MNDHRWLLHVPIHQLLLLLFRAKASEKNRLWFNGKSAGLKQRNKSEVSSSMETDPFIPAKGSLPRDFLSRDSEYKGPGWSHSWTRDKADCSHRQWDTLLIPKGSFHGLTGDNGFCDTSNKNTWTTILVQIKGQNHLRVRLDDPCGSFSAQNILWSVIWFSVSISSPTDMQEWKSRPSIQNTSSYQCITHHCQVRDSLSLLWFLCLANP